MIDNVAAAGTPDEVTRKLRDFVAAGVEHFIFMPAPTPTPTTTSCGVWSRTSFPPCTPRPCRLRCRKLRSRQPAAGKA